MRGKKGSYEWLVSEKITLRTVRERRVSGEWEMRINIAWNVEEEDENEEEENERESGMQVESCE